MAQARALRNKAAVYEAWEAHAEDTGWGEVGYRRMRQKCERWAEKFERMAADCA